MIDLVISRGLESPTRSRVAYASDSLGSYIPIEDTLIRNTIQSVQVIAHDGAGLLISLGRSIGCSQRLYAVHDGCEHHSWLFRRVPTKTLLRCYATRASDLHS